MNSHEYETRRRALDEQLEAGIELLRAAHRAQVRAIDYVWSTSPENRNLLPPGAVAPPAGLSPLAPRPAEPLPSSPPRRRWRTVDLQAAIEDALDHLPEVFDRNDLAKALGSTPDRTTIYRILQDLCYDGVLAIEERGGGRTATRYRRLEPAGEEPAEEPETA
jgi:hypothetical protein